MAWSIRKGCFRCGRPLTNFKERVTRTCETCAKKALDGFQQMSEGKVKDGFKTVTTGYSDQEKEEINNTIDNVLAGKRRRVEKVMRKKGYTDEQIKEGLDAFDRRLDE